MFLLRAYKNLNDLKKEFHENIESLINGSSDSNATSDSTTAGSARTGSSSNQQQQQQTGARRQIPDDPLIDPLAAGRRPHPYPGAWLVETRRSYSRHSDFDNFRGQIPGGYGPGMGAYGSSDLDPFGRNTRGGGKI